jgi:carbonic anhydrase/acetyltransferase-like protein (isoleucine patch superfamily)
VVGLARRRIQAMFIKWRWCLTRRSIHATYLKSPTAIGNNVSIGHNIIVHGCTIHDNVLVSMGSIIMDDCVIESNSIVQLE